MSGFAAKANYNGKREREEASGESTGRPITGLGHDAPLAFAALSQLTWHVQVLG